MIKREAFIIPSICLLLILLGCAGPLPPSGTAPVPATSSEPSKTEVAIEEWNVEIEHVGIEKVDLESFEVVLRNTSSRPINIGVISLHAGNSENKRMFSTEMNPGAKRSFSVFTSEPLERPRGARSLGCKIIVGEDIGKVMSPIIAEKEISISIPTAGIGYTQRVGILKEKTITLTLLSWKEGDKALAGPYPDGTYYIYTPRPGNKFIMLIYELRNDWSQSQKTPHIKFGDMLTDNGEIYSAWQAPSDPANLSQEYIGRPATDEEITTLIRYSGGRELASGESIKGRIIFEIPEEENPVEASIHSLRPLIEYDGEQ